MVLMTIIMSRFSGCFLRYTSVGMQRKTFNTIGMWCPAVCLIILSLIPKSKEAAIILLTLCVGFTSATNSGFKITTLDISPNFAGTITGIGFAIGCVPSLLSPALVGYVVTDAVRIEHLLVTL